MSYSLFFTGTPGKAARRTSSSLEDITVSAFAIMKTSAPLIFASRALRTACAASLTSMYPQRFHLRRVGSPWNSPKVA